MQNVEYVVKLDKQSQTFGNKCEYEEFYETTSKRTPHVSGGVRG